MQNRRAATRLEAAAPFATQSVSGTGDPNPGDGRAFPARTVRTNVSRDRFTAPPIRPAPGTSPERHSHAIRIRKIFKNTGWRIFRQITISLHFIRRIPENSLKRSESPEDYHRAIIPYRSILILRRLRAATPAKNKDAFRHPYRNDSLNRPERSVRRRHTCHIGFQPATNAVPRHSPNKLALHSAHNIILLK